MQEMKYDSEIVPTTQPAPSRAFKMPLSVDLAALEHSQSVTINTGPSQALMKVCSSAVTLSISSAFHLLLDLRQYRILGPPLGPLSLQGLG